MARCKWCGEKFDQDELTARGYCEDCNKELRDNIKSLQKQLDELYEDASPDLPPEEKQKIIDSTYSAYSQLKSYKDKKVAFFTSDIEEPRKRVYRKLNIDPPPAPKKTSWFVGVAISVLVSLFVIVIIIDSAFSHNPHLSLNEDIPIVNDEFYITLEELAYRFEINSGITLSSIVEESSGSEGYTQFSCPLSENTSIYFIKNNSTNNISSIRFDVKSADIDNNNFANYILAGIHSVRPNFEAEQIWKTWSFDLKKNPKNSPVRLTPLSDIGLILLSEENQTVFAILAHSENADSFNAATEKIVNSAKKTRSFSKQLCSGHYTVGIDIPEGTYKFTAVKRSGNVYSSNYSFYGDGINEIMGVPSSNEYVDIHEEKIEDIYLPEGEVLSISGVVIGATARDASAEPLEKRDQEISETVTLKDGVFVSGTDFEPGVYCIEAVSGGGNVYTEDGDDYGINAIIGTSDQNTNGTDLYEQQFNNVSLPDRCILYVSDVEIKLTPSK